MFSGFKSRDRDLAVALEEVGQVLPFDERHRQVLDAVQFTQVVNADHVLVGNLASQHELPLEPPLHFAGGSGVQQYFRSNDLKGNGDTEFRIPRLVNDAHATGAERADDVIAAAE